LLTQEECSERVGKNRSTVTNFLRLLKLPSEIQKGLSSGGISTGHARALISVQNSDTQINIYHDIVANGCSVREVEQLAKDFRDKNYKRTSKKKAISIPNLLPFQQQKMAHDLSRNLDTEIKHKVWGCGEKQI
jgi:ParB family chromosome partitioning protein